jgi:hypothetical protein
MTLLIAMVSARVFGKLTTHRALVEMTDDGKRVECQRRVIRGRLAVAEREGVASHRTLIAVGVRDADGRRVVAPRFERLDVARPRQRERDRP